MNSMISISMNQRITMVSARAKGLVAMCNESEVSNVELRTSSEITQTTDTYSPTLSSWWDDVHEASDVNERTCKLLARRAVFDVKRKLSFSPPRVTAGDVCGEVEIAKAELSPLKALNVNTTVLEAVHHLKQTNNICNAVSYSKVTVGDVCGVVEIAKAELSPLKALNVNTTVLEAVHHLKQTNTICNAVANFKGTIKPSQHDVKFTVDEVSADNSLRIKIHQGFQNTSLSPATCTFGEIKDTEGGQYLDDFVEPDSSSGHPVASISTPIKPLYPSQKTIHEASQALNAGKEHINTAGKLKRARVPKASCRVECQRCESPRLTESERVAISKTFWDLQNHEKQWLFIHQSIQLSAPRRKCGIKGGKKEKHMNRNYSFHINKKKRKVCKTMFKSTLNICDSWIVNALSHCSDGHLIMQDRRGKVTSIKPIVASSLTI